MHEAVEIVLEPEDDFLFLARLVEVQLLLEQIVADAQQILAVMLGQKKRAAPRPTHATADSAAPARRPATRETAHAAPERRRAAPATPRRRRYGSESWARMIARCFCPQNDADGHRSPSPAPVKCAGAPSDAPARGLLHYRRSITASAASPEGEPGLPERGRLCLGLAPRTGQGAAHVLDVRRESGCLRTFGQTLGQSVGHERVAPGLILRRPHAVADEERHRFQFIRQRTVRLGVATQILGFVRT